MSAFVLGIVLMQVQDLALGLLNPTMLAKLNGIHSGWHSLPSRPLSASVTCKFGCSDPTHVTDKDAVQPQLSSKECCLPLVSTWTSEP